MLHTEIHRLVTVLGLLLAALALLFAVVVN